ncbi:MULTISPECIES: hypothetical protein [unclassified Motilimonas]|uniref:hypothetical protein n=1 Tax=Motilimonas TaxID=1914248 RepID=UPI001E3118AD|nr:MULTISPECIES: hypothetical protein [unclassified Motilimonas]MCE0558266.1 hypothetical protein [Motilimonas sp. E26]MDO6524630.1 hypothetical protein [Motilimonas sp. 1_MG-2023]
MAQSIYLTLADFFIQLDTKRTVKKQKKIEALSTQQLSAHILKDIGLEHEAHQRVNHGADFDRALHRIKTNT